VAKRFSSGLSRKGWIDRKLSRHIAPGRDIGLSTRELATAVTNHMSIFFAENGVSKNPIDCVNVQLMRAE